MIRQYKMPQPLPGLPTINVYMEEPCRRGANCDWKDLWKECQWSKKVNLSLFWSYFFMYMFFSLHLIRRQEWLCFDCKLQFHGSIGQLLVIMRYIKESILQVCVLCKWGYEFQLVGVRHFVWWLIAFIAVYLVNVLELA